MRMKYVDGKGEMLSAKGLANKILAGAMMPVDSTGYDLDNNADGVKRVFVIRSMPECITINFEKEPVEFDWWNDFEGMCIANNAEIHFMPFIQLPVISNGDYLLTTDDMSLYRMTIKTE
jgi:hypothetical protein